VPTSTSFCHQTYSIRVVKGAFKDNLMEWVVEYLHQVHGKAGAKEILADIDRR
jgi:hypothetical protein